MPDGYPNQQERGNFEMRISCPECDSAIPSENINIKTGLAKCACGEVFRIKVGAADTDAGEIAPQKPAGTRIEIEETPSNEMHVWIPARFKAQVIPLVIFSLFWNGMVIFFLVMAFGGGVKGDGPPLLFMLPFVLVGVLMIFFTCWMIFGKSSVHINSLGVAVVKELFGLRKRTVMPLDVVGDIRVEDTSTRVNNVPQRAVTIHYGAKYARFGTGMSEVERQWIAYEMKKFLEKLRPS